MPTLTDPEQKFSVSYAKDAVYKQGLREFMEYRDLGLAEATNGKVHAHILRVKDINKGTDQDMHTTGPHQHMVDLQFYIVLKGWIKFIYEGQDGELTFRAGDCVHAPAAIRHNEISCSDDLEVLEVLSPAIHETRSVDTIPGHEVAAA
jgi:mannose-6-phosphate isomerase-like protein (cupin superfamily)